ncbi:MAG: sorbosone dehydrogenase [Mucilaginibacter sp.]|nr:sorbosone dehydrogenase [Mucilaginibacter sp.]
MNKKVLLTTGFVAAVLSLAGFIANKRFTDRKADLKLPTGFSATIVADSLGPVRHLAVTGNGDVYIKLNALRKGKGIYFLSDTNHDGRLDKKLAFANYPGTGIKIKDHYLYSASNTGIFRYKLNSKDDIIDADSPEVIVQGLADKVHDNSKSMVLDDQGNLFVTIGSWSDACRQAGSGQGIPGCPILDSAAGIWKFKANKLNQTLSDGIHYAKGIKNAVGIDINPVTKTVFATHHGRGSFDDKFPQYYTPKQSAELPAETVYELHEGTDAGWPFAYYDQIQKKKMLAPEYGGDGKTTTDKYADPAVAFPAHLAPNDLLFYTGNMFPKRYKNGAFVVLHGQSASPKKGYFVAFIPFVNGKVAGEWEVFADNFAGTDLEHPSGPIKYRPIGLAQGPDGALYIADDVKGAIFKIVYKK